jgi:hypothetical protein
VPRTAPFSEQTSLAVKELKRLIERTAPWHERLLAVHEEYVQAPARDAGLSLEEATRQLADYGGEIFGMVLEDLCTRRYPGGQSNIVDDLLQRRGRSHPPATREYLEALRDSAPGLYEVVAVRPGHGVTVRNQFTGADPVEVVEIAASRQLAQWDRVAARVVSLGGIYVFTGALIPFRVPEADELLARFRETLDAGIDRGGRTSSAAFRAKLHEIARSFAPVIARRRIELLLDGEKGPALHNREGHPIEFIEAAHSVAAGKRRAVIAALDSEPNLARSGARPPTWEWAGRVKSTSGASTGPEPGFEIDFHDTRDPDMVLLGTLTLSRGRLVLSVNSRARLSRLMELLQPRMAGLLGPVKISSTEAELLSEAGPPAGRPRPRPGKVERELMARHLEVYYRNWLDEPVPALGGRTPRAAAQDFEGRQQLVSLLRYMENMQARAPSEALRYDFRKLWRALGIERLRR